MYDTLLFLHVLAAFALVAAIVMFSAYTLGIRPTPGAFTLACRLEDVGGLGTIVLGIWLALDVDGYSITDGWILAAIVMWLAAGGTGNAYRQAVQPVFAAAGAAAAEVAGGVQRAATMHWVRTAFTLLLLIDMIWKPGA